MPNNYCQIALTTERLTLRRFTIEDADSLYDLDNDPEVMRYLNGGLPTPWRAIEEQMRQNFLCEDDAQAAFGFWAVDNKTTGKFLGWISLRPTDGIPGEASIGYRFCKAAWGKGYATEGCRAILNKAFDEWGLQRVTATTYEENIASQRVMEKLDMTVARRFRLTPEQLAQVDTYHVDSIQVWDGDDIEYELKKEEWEFPKC